MHPGSAPLKDWPWATMGSLKYILYGPLFAKALYTNFGGGSEVDNWCFHILLISGLRCLVCQLWLTYSNMHFLTKTYKIRKHGVEFKQVDREWDWDNFVIFQAYMFTAAHHFFPFFRDMPLWNSQGSMYVILLHIGPAEALYYIVHRLFHQNFFFNRYHSLHHASVTVQPSTAGSITFLENLFLTCITAIPILGSSGLRGGSILMLYLYVLCFDFLRCMGHSNVEVMPAFIYRCFPFLKFFIYTPCYHGLHHVEMKTNFCLFVPLYDYLGNTMNPKSWLLHKSVRNGQLDRVPQYVFLAHVVDMLSSLHVPFVFRSFASKPFTTQWFLLPIWPFTVPVMFAMWAWAKPFVHTSYLLRDLLHHTWVIPRFGFQYFLPFAQEGINNLIEEAILSADSLGVKVISLAALNKNEALNGGGTLFVQKHPNLRVRVVHGNTLTAAVILNEIHPDVKEVFLTGATSKLGRAVALYLCKQQVRVLMLTASTERFQTIQKEAPVQYQRFLVQVTKYQAAQNCKTWIVGKWISFREQNWAPCGTHFHQFVVPPIFQLRRDCTYGKLAAMELPADVEGLATCEYTMSRRIVHACHAGGVVHSLEGWDHHEVGAIDVDRIGIVWNAALKHGFKPV
ncbi:hypothetical protein SUGI_0921120 [Cryptomeria japonica]|nr:hypothetical protein SUGI_0921120 [Cryptomeria japonica]